MSSQSLDEYVLIKIVIAIEECHWVSEEMFKGVILSVCWVAGPLSQPG